MVYLHWEANDFGLEKVSTVKAAYASLEEARTQAEHDQARGRHPLYIEDEQGMKLWEVAQA